jgi:CRP-like cAMP-binding protein
VGEEAWLVQEGEVELLAGPAESLKRVRVATQGDVFGEMVLVDERLRDTTARAVTAGRAVPIARELFEQHLLHTPLPILECLRALFERLRSTSETASRADDAPRTHSTPPTDSLQPAPHSAPPEFPVSHGEVGQWSVVIHPLTSKAAETLPEEGLLVTRFPLRLGRAAAAGEGEALNLNDLWLLDESPYNISRNHCEIFLDAQGPSVRDRGSHLGCIVNEAPIGGPATSRSGLLEIGENVLIVGARMSPYQFRVIVARRG